MNFPAPFTQRQHEYMARCLSSWFNVAEGGKRGSKNVLQTYVFCKMLETHQNRLHLVAGVSVATAKLNILDCDGFGLSNYFEGRYREGRYKDRDCVYVQTKTGEKIVLVSGGGKNGDEKLIKGNTYGMAYITEANECHENFIKEVFDRTLSSTDRKIFHDLNPKSQLHWYYEKILDIHEEKKRDNPSYGYNYGHFTIADNLSISGDKLRKVLETYNKGSVWYRRDILGIRAAAEGLVYPMFSREKHVVHGLIEYHKDSLYYVSIDYGTVNPFAVGLFEYSRRTRKSTMIKELHYEGRKQPRVDNEKYYAMMCDLIGDIPIEYIIVDPSAAAFIETIKKYAKYIVKGADNDVLNGIQEVTKYLNQGLLLIHESCEETLKEFEAYAWDEESGEDKVIKENDHHLDALRYYCQSIARTLNRWII